MIRVYYGLPSAGKGYRMAKDALAHMRRGRRVYSTCYLQGARRLYTLVDCMFEEFAGALFCIDEAGTFFDARKTLQLDSLLFSALTLHAKNGTDLFFCCQSPKYLDMRIREVTEQWVHCRRVVGGDSRRALAAGRKPRFWERPWRFSAVAYKMEDFTADMELLGEPEPVWQESYWFRKSVAEKYNSLERTMNQDDLLRLAEAHAGAASRADAPIWVERGVEVLERRVPANVQLPANPKLVL